MNDTTDLSPSNPLSVDIAIIGSGPVGMILALALADSPYRVRLFDRQARGAWACDPRALALSHGSRQLLERHAVWNDAAATPIHDIHVSQRGGFGRTVIDCREYGVPALGSVMRYRDLAAALDARIDAAQRVDRCRVLHIDTAGDAARLTVQYDDATERTVRARLVVHAEGSGDDDAQHKIRDYRQHAVLAELRPAEAHGNRAWERFTPDGPLALLPIGDAYSAVLTVPPEKAERLLSLDDDAFLAAAREQFGGCLNFVATGPRAGFPLTLRVRRQRIAPRQIWIGNSAQVLHPVSGQGLNLGLRDACELAAALLSHRNGDVGDPTLLAAYARSRRLDRDGGVAFTDSIVRLFSNDLPPLRCARGLGLLALDLCPPLRHFIARRMIWGARAWL